MHACSKTLVFLLLAAVAAAPLTAPDFHPEAASHDRPAPCHLSTDHDDGGSLPTPAPVSHSCCQGAHHPAILPQNSSLQPSLEVSAQVESFQHTAAVSAFNFFPSFTASSGPPLLSPLRV
ncbi:MAG TPA: hypothetical protein VN950_18000 [Terriglobales bacterium]|nr:hypothetical protein [Terriglobales bacterium]